MVEYTNQCCLPTLTYELSGTLSNKCITSISINSSTNTSKIGNCVLIGPTIGTISISGYADDKVYVGCPGKAGVQIPWVRKYDCDLNKVHFLFSGQGKSFVAGEVNDLAKVVELVTTQSVISVSVRSVIYTDMNQKQGYGLIYKGDPISFDTSDEDSLLFDAHDIGANYSECYLQSFSLDMGPGQIPIANYSYVFFINN